MRKQISSHKVDDALKPDDNGERAFFIFLAVSLASLTVLTLFVGFVAR